MMGGLVKLVQDIKDLTLIVGGSMMSESFKLLRSVYVRRT